MTVRSRNLVAAWNAWARDRRDLEPDVVATLVSMRRNYLDDGPDGRWHSGQLTELLLDVIPRKVMADAQWTESVVPTVRSFLQYAADTGRLDRDSAPLSQLLAELDGIEPLFGAAMRDDARAGLAKSILGAVGIDGFDVDEPAALQAAMDRFNALGEDRRRAITGPAVPDDPTPVTLPPMLLPPLSQLAEAARRSPLMQHVVAMATWVGRRREVTPTGVLKLADARAAVEALRLWPLVRPDAGPTSGSAICTAPQLELGLPEPPPLQFRSARDCAPLHLLWILSTSVGLVDVSVTVAAAGPQLRAWQQDDDADVLRIWSDVFAVALDLGVDGGQERRWVFAGRVAVDQELPAVLPELYLGESLVVDDLVDHMTITASRLGDPDAGLHRRIVAVSLSRLLQRFVDLGAMTLHRDRPDDVVDADDTSDVVTMTALGKWGMRQQFEAFGAEAPVIRAAESSADELVRLMGVTVSPEQAALAWSEWIQARGRLEAARLLVEAGRAGTAMTRTAVFGILDSDLPEEAEQELKAHLKDPSIGTHARAWLVGRGRLPQSEAPTAQEVRWLGVDAAASLFEALPDGIPPRDLPPEAWVIVDEVIELETVWQIGHPQLLQILDTVGKGHPSGRVRKAAKKAAFKARSRGATKSSG